MAFLLFFMGFHVGWVPSAKLEPILKLASLPEDGDFFLQAPQQVSVDESGRFFVLDVESYAVFIWKNDGSYLEKFGKQGQGPGEFVFSGRRGGAQGYMAIQNGKVFIFDPAKREILTFSAKDYAFLGSAPFQLSRGRPEYCVALPNDQFLVYYRQFSEEGVVRHVGIFNSEGKLEKPLQSFEDETFRMSPGSGRDRSITLKAFAANPVVSFDAKLDQVIIGDPSASQFGLFDRTGKKIKAVKFQMPRSEVTKKDIDEYNEQPFIKNSNRVTAEFPEFKAYYDQILPLKEGGYLVFNRSPFYRTAEGIAIDGEGNLLGKFMVKCGENGDLVGNSGRLFGIFTDDEGEFTLQELQVVTKPNS